jgi:transcriptional regulator with XRE-family HTH domain
VEEVVRRVGLLAAQLLGKQLRAARRATKRTQADVATALNWPKTRVSLVETARVRLSPADAVTLLDLYNVTGTERETLLGLVEAAADGSTDALAWITSRSFRKTVATILDEAGQSGRQVADQLGHARASMTQDHYIGRKVLNPGAAAALDAALELPDGPIV